MRNDDLLQELKRSAADSVRLAGEVPRSILGIAVGWTLETDPNDSAGRDGLRITWRTYFQAKPDQADIEFANSCSDALVDHLWSRIIWIEHEIMVASGRLELPLQFDRWLFLRQQDAA